MLVTFRISSLIVTEAGPGDVFAKLRHAVGVRHDEYSQCVGHGLAGAFCCVFCMSLWVSAVVALAVALYRGDSWLIAALDWFGFSAGAIIVESVVHHG